MYMCVLSDGVLLCMFSLIPSIRLFQERGTEGGREGREGERVGERGERERGGEGGL